jgi:peptidyl-tRNA hydrolase
LKQVIIVNESLKLPSGKLAAQVAHAAVQGFIEASPGIQKMWLGAGMPKVVLSCSSEKELIDLAERASHAGLAVALIRDAGRTVVAPGTVTCLCIGPDKEGNIDPLTGHMELVK